MKKKYLFACIFILTAAFISFGYFQFDFLGEDEEEIAIAKAESVTAQFINQIYRAYFTGDLSELKQFVAEKDTEGIIRDILKEKGIDLEAPRMRIMGGTIDLPGFDDPTHFEDGSVLLSRTVGSTTSDLLASIIPGIYTHCGLLDQDLYTSNDADAGCIITADLSGVTYETWNDWANYDGTSKIVTKLNVKADPGVWPQPWQLYRAQRWIRWYMGWTIYSFLKLNLDPVSRWDPIRWYCSKTVWRVLNRRGLDLDVENVDLYTTADMYQNENSPYYVRSSILYQLLKKYVGEYIAEKKLWAALEECITPDEIRFATTDEPFGTVGGPLDFQSKESWGNINIDPY